MKDKKNTVISAGIGYTIGNYLLKGLTFLTIPIFSRLLTPLEYGMYSTYLAYESILFIIVGLALHVSLKNAKYKYKDKFDDYSSSCLILTIGNSLIWLILVVLLYPLYKSWVGFSLTIMVLMVVQSCCSALLTYYNSYISINYEYKSFIIIGLLNGVLNIVLSIVFILFVFENDNVSARIYGTIIPLAIVGIYTLVYFWKKKAPKVNKRYWRFALKYSIPIIPHGISQVVLNQFDRIMITSIKGGIESGIYSFAYNIYSILFVTVSSLETVWGPWFYEKLKNGEKDKIRKRGNDFALVILIFCCLLLLASPELILILGTRKYVDSIYSVIPIVVGGYFAFLYFLPCQVEYYYAKTKYIAVGSVSAALINIVLNSIFIPRYGYIAAGYTTLITYMLYFIFHFYIAKRIQKQNLYDTKKIVLYCILLFVVATLTLAFVKSFIIRWIFVLVIGVIGFIWANKEFNILMMINKKIRRA